MRETAVLPIGELVHPSRPAVRPERRLLTAARFELRPLDPARDADDLFRVGNDGPGTEVLWTYMG